jgi:hypothetical protein
MHLVRSQFVLELQMHLSALAAGVNANGPTHARRCEDRRCRAARSAPRETMIPLTRRQELLLLLLAKPDAPDLPTRGHRWLYRSPRNREALKQDLLVRWMVRREIESAACQQF